jgi:hypothetical protein
MTQRSAAPWVVVTNSPLRTQPVDKASPWVIRGSRLLLHFSSFARDTTKYRVPFRGSVKAAPLQTPYLSSLPQLRFSLPSDICPK